MLGNSSSTKMAYFYNNGTTEAPDAETKDYWMTIGEPILAIVFSFGVFRAMQFIARWYLFGKWTLPRFDHYAYTRRRNRENKSVPDIKSIDVVPPNKKWRKSNEVVSLIHSAISGLWALHLFTTNTMLLDEDRKLGEGLVYATFGYLVSDFIDLLLNESSSRIFELLFHHVVVVCAFMVTLITRKFMGVVIIGLLMEVNSIFLHTRSLLNLYGISKVSTAFKFVALLDVVTYLACRMFVSVYLIYWWALSFTISNWALYVVNFLVIISLFSTNSVLFYRVLAADGLLGKRRARELGRSARAQNTDPVKENGEDTEEDIDDKATTSKSSTHSTATAIDPTATAIVAIKLL